MTRLKKMSPVRFIVLGFAIVILLGSILLSLPISHNPGVDVTPIDALFTSTSAVCVTGLVTLDTGSTFSIFGRIIIAILIQIGGLGFASVGVGLMLLTRRRVRFKERILIKETLNLNSMKGIVKLVRAILFMTLFFEIIGTLINYTVFSKSYSPLNAVGISIFHSISAFNNAGFDILGNFQSLASYKDSIILNIATCGLIIFGGLGFIVIKEIIEKHSFKNFSLHSKVVVTMTLTLLLSGAIMLKITENINWLTAFFFSTSSRTAGFATISLNEFSNAGLFIMIILMFIGASPGSTGGGIKTTAMFALLVNAYSTATNNHCSAFKRKIPRDVISKAYIIASLAIALICTNILLISIFEPNFEFMDIFFEVVSAFGTVGLSTGITPDLGIYSKSIIILTMFIGRLGPLTIATLLAFKQKSGVSYSEEPLTVG
jgi:trk system potassium uptake protein TrkH